MNYVSCLTENNPFPKNLKKMTNNMEAIPVRVESSLQMTAALWSDMLGFSGLITSCRIIAAPAFIAELIVLQLQ